jgi:hypothetical protein
MTQTTLKGEPSYDELHDSVIAKIRTVRERVRYLLEHYPSTKGNDRELLIRYYRIFEPQIGLRVRDFDALLHMTSFDTVKRRRQELQENGEYLPTSHTIRKRRMIAAIPQSEIRAGIV